jgi:phospholipid/cholesterol/gamma-HCH transport system permease protein
MKRVSETLDNIGRSVLSGVEQMGGMLILLISTFGWIFRPPLKLRAIIKQMEFVGVKSTFVVVLTGTFTGMVLALQSYHGFRLFSAEGLVGSTVALSMTRELGPVLTGLMVTARAGSAMAAELGTMRVTEQIDALYVMAANPIKYLIVPRIIASVFMVPLLTAISDFLGIIGGYFVGVVLLDINEGIFLDNIYKYVELDDIYNGLIKAAFFGLLLSLIGCYKGFNTRGGAEGVGMATTEAVVIASVSILVADYFLTAIMF